jgi:phospholipase/carboxylesterase
MLTTYRLAPLNGGAPQRLVIFLHGLGDRGDGGLLSIGQFWRRSLPTCEFLCPDAPFAYDMAPPDFGGRQWFGLHNFDPVKIEAGILAAAPILNGYIDQVLAERSLAPRHLALVGFSQGAMMALYVAPRRAEPIACVIGYSGLLHNAAALKAEKRSAPPVLLMHGTADDVVPYASLAAAERGLQEAGIPVRSVTCQGLGHGIDERGIQEGLTFLQEYLI